MTDRAISADIPTQKRARRLPGSLRFFSTVERLDTTVALQVATRIVAVPYMAAVTLATALAWKQSQVSWVGVLAVAGGGVLIAAAEVCRVFLLRRGRAVSPWLILAVFVALHLLVGINAWNSGGIDGGLWLSLTVLSSVGGALLPMRLSVTNGASGMMVFLGTSAAHGQIDRMRAPTLVLGAAIIALGSPTASVFRDVIVREAGRRLRQQVAQLELFNLMLTAVIQSMTEGLVACDGAGRVELWNRRLESLTGIPELEAVGKPVWEVLKLADRHGMQDEREHPCVLALDGPVFRGSVLGGSPGEISLISATGESIPVTVTAAPLMRDGQAAGVVAVVVDVSRERELAQTRDALVSMVSHELRTPLTMIVGFSELLLAGEFDKEQVEECASEILYAANRLSGLVDDLLSTAALERGSLQLNKRLVALSSLVDQSVASFGPEERKRVETRLEESYLLVDPDRITQVLANLIGNALKYSDKSTKVEVRSRRQNGYVSIDVVDQGYGIDEATLSNLFTMFTRSSDERVRKIPGTGLGLHIAKRLTEMHGGDIEVTTRKGGGSTFTVVLPLEGEAALQTENEAPG